MTSIVNLVGTKSKEYEYNAFGKKARQTNAHQTHSELLTVSKAMLRIVGYFFRFKGSTAMNTTTMTAELFI